MISRIKQQYSFIYSSDKTTHNFVYKNKNKDKQKFNFRYFRPKATYCFLYENFIEIHKEEKNHLLYREGNHINIELNEKAIFKEYINMLIEQHKKIIFKDREKLFIECLKQDSFKQKQNILFKEIQGGRFDNSNKNLSSLAKEILMFIIDKELKNPENIMIEEDIKSIGYNLLHALGSLIKQHSIIYNTVNNQFEKYVHSVYVVDELQMWQDFLLINFNSTEILGIDSNFIHYYVSALNSLLFVQKDISRQTSIAMKERHKQEIIAMSDIVIYSKYIKDFYTETMAKALKLSKDKKLHCHQRALLRKTENFAIEDIKVTMLSMLISQNIEYIATPFLEQKEYLEQLIEKKVVLNLEKVLGIESFKTMAYFKVFHELLDTKGNMLDLNTVWEVLPLQTQYLMCLSVFYEMAINNNEKEVASVCNEELFEMLFKNLLHNEDNATLVFNHQESPLVSTKYYETQTVLHTKLLEWTSVLNLSNEACASFIDYVNSENIFFAFVDKFLRFNISEAFINDYIQLDYNQYSNIASHNSQSLLNLQKQLIKDIHKSLEAYTSTISEEESIIIDREILNLFIQSAIDIESETDLQLLVEKEPIAMTIYKRGWFIRGTSPTDLIVLPNVDYPYTENPVSVEDYYKDWDVYYWQFEEIFHLVETHPIPDGSELGTHHIEVSIEIMVDMVNMVLMLWAKFYEAFQGWHGVGAVKGLMIVVYNWLMLESSIEDMKSKESYDDYMRCYRWLRWEAEMVVNKAREDYTIGGNGWVEFYVMELFRYLSKHHFDTVPIFKSIVWMDLMRDVFRDPQGNIEIVLDKVKGMRFYSIEGREYFE